MTDTIKKLRESLNSQGGRFGCFSENFYTFIREQIGITHLYCIENEKGPSIQERNARVDKMVYRATLDDDKLSPSEAQLACYSEEALDLSALVKKIGHQRDICNKQFLTRFFKTFFLQRAGVERLDSGLLDFFNLTELDLSHNKIQELDFMSPSLQQLNLTANMISKISCPRSESLIHLGLAYCPIDNAQLANISRCFPNLFSLDLAFTKITDLQAVCDCMENLPKLKMINFKGSPVCLANKYRSIIKQRFQQLKYLDGVIAFTEAEEALKKKQKRKFDAYGNEIIDLSGQMVIEPEFKFEMCIGLLSNVQGVYLQAENMPHEFDLSAIRPEDKSSVFQCQFVDHIGKTISSEPKVWINDFQVDKESHIGKSDFKFVFKTDRTSGIDCELHNWLKSDIFVQLHHRQPVLKPVKQEDESIVKEAVLVGGIPRCESTCIGVMRIDTSKLLIKEELENLDCNSHTLKHFYDPKEVMCIPEFRFQNHLINVKELDYAILKEDLESAIEEKRVLAEKQAAALSGASASVTPQNAKKPDPKKDAKKPDPKKGAAVVDDPNQPKEIHIEYPTDDLKNEDDFSFVDRNFSHMKNPPAVKAKPVAGAIELLDKRTVRSNELQESIRTIKGTAVTAAIRVRLNYVAPPVEIKEEEVVVENTKAAPKGKSKK